MRGKVRRLHDYGYETRITPAYAGKRKSVPSEIPYSQDHPCVCGEKSQLEPLHPPVLGSPLRMRGKEFRKWRI